MAHQTYENFILESKLNDLLETKLNTRSLMTVDNSLAEGPGMKKIINVYNYEGAVEALAMGEANTVKGQVTFSPVEYVVGVHQQTFEYYDEQVMIDPKILDMAIKGASQTMVNDMNDKFFAELAKATLTSTYAAGEAFDYNAVVDALDVLNVEEESNLVLIMGIDLRTAIRKDPDFKASRAGDILYNGQIGSIAGVPVVISNLVPEGEAYLMEKGAISLFVKKESEVEQDRDIETRENTVVMRKVALVALTDATKVVKISEAVA